jgi:hypothetical protein
MNIDVVPISGLLYIINLLTMVSIAWYLWKRYLSTQNIVTKHLSLSFAYLAIFVFFMILPHIFWNQPEKFTYWASRSAFFGFIFLFVSFAYHASVPLFFRWQASRKIVLGVILVIGAITLTLSWFYPSQPIIDENTGITVLQNNIVAGILTGVAALLSRGLFAIIFWLEHSRVKDHLLRKRATFFSVGSALLFLGGPALGITRELSLLMLGEILLMIGLFMIWVGVYFIHPDNESEKLIKQSIPLPPQVE